MRKNIKDQYRFARDSYGKLGVDTDSAINRLKDKSISLHCWQGDDVAGFEPKRRGLSGGIQVTGNYPGRARNISELKQDLELALCLIPGKNRVSLHAIYGDFGEEPVERNEIKIDHFQTWIEWARQKNLAIDFNSTLFSHPWSENGFTLSSKNNEIRRFWVEHIVCCRKIAEEIGKKLNQPVIHNLWIPDGMKDVCIDRIGYRRLLLNSLNEIFKKNYNKKFLKDALEPKLFGIGTETYVVGSFEFYLGYALKNNLMLCLDLGHFHPTESVADKISSLLLFMKEIYLHISRGVRWDSDHIPIFDDTLKDLFLEIVRSDALNRVHIGLDYFDATLNRVGAWVVGARAVQKAILYALLEPKRKLLEYEVKKDYLSRLCLYENLKTMPFNGVWDYYCLISDVPLEPDWLIEIHKYEKTVLSKRI
uniref:L-rhamnose isomerase n=1 Tax=candidate division WOR-3 bacterium TaxID=2052148 RepID=A0A7C6AER0_UNCW3